MFLYYFKYSFHKDKRRRNSAKKQLNRKSMDGPLDFNNKLYENSLHGKNFITYTMRETFGTLKG
jgi:hypothetical protein